MRIQVLWTFTLRGQPSATSRTLCRPGVAACAVLLAATAYAVFGQSTATQTEAANRPKFEVASIKVNSKCSNRRASTQAPSPGRRRYRFSDKPIFAAIASSD